MFSRIHWNRKLQKLPLEPREPLEPSFIQQQASSAELLQLKASGA
jgi:hypothetical protein